jgi:hypothetical protein
MVLIIESFMLLIEVVEYVRKPRPKSNPAVSMVNSRGRKKSANYLHNIP